MPLNNRFWCLQRVCELENQIHHTELNAMEAETVRRKYRSIRSGLLNDSVRFEVALSQVEGDIRKQEAEIKRLQVGTSYLSLIGTS